MRDRFVGTMARLYEQDVAGGQLAAAQEIVAGSSSSPGLGARIVELLDPWIAFAEQIMRRLVQGTAVEPLVPTEEAACALVAPYLGVETLAHLDADDGRIGEVFRAGARLAPALDALLRPTRRSDPVAEAEPPAPGPVHFDRPPFV